MAVRLCIQMASQQGGGAARAMPLRGVFTGNLSMLRTLHIAGVPVWWVRPLHSLTTRTKIRSVRDPVEWGLSFATERTAVLGKTAVVAPKWLDGTTIDSCSYGLTRRLTRYSLTNRPLVRLPVAAFPQDDASQPEPAGPAVPQPPSREEAPPKKKAKKGKSKPAIPRDLPVRPAWLPEIHPAWAGLAARLVSLEVRQSKPLLYGLPPPHAFGSNTGAKIHNWLRLREWCYSEAQRLDDEPKILLTAGYWRIALEGRYHAMSYDANAKVLPQSSPDLIARLPPAPGPDHPSTSAHPTAASLGKRTFTMADGVEQEDPRGTRTPTQRARNAAERVDIAVRFGVHGGIPPYHPDQTPKWRGVAVDRARVDEDQALWAEVLWELTVAQFRLEFLWMEMEVMESAYADSYELVRQRDATRIWTYSGAVLPDPDSDPPTVDWLLSEDWRVRLAGATRFRNYIAAWPGMPTLPVAPKAPATRPELEGFEAAVYEAYCTYFGERKARLPTMPPRRPSTLPQDAE
ncbi:hypothetical protein BV25DRAFT_1922393 [Artomyces pyxidatus]|uniref:Uncharacterized protein n=1 Tax=Artomyces pyxidatus TaxID=48021 RepID=A0ACB8SFQ9_9AGAM|nr:hypothetical protein BV25DRAFT_1922393 [Artomyces pyxidatus]